MRAYLDETYGSSLDPGGSRPVQMGALRPPKREARVAPPPTTHDEEVAQRLYATLEASAAEDAERAATAVTPRQGMKVRAGRRSNIARVQAPPSCLCLP
jgi:hypothetical protein